MVRITTNLFDLEAFETSKYRIKLFVFCQGFFGVKGPLQFALSVLYSRNGARLVPIVPRSNLFDIAVCKQNECLKIADHIYCLS